MPVRLFRTHPPEFWKRPKDIISALTVEPVVEYSDLRHSGTSVTELLADCPYGIAILWFQQSVSPARTPESDRKVFAQFVEEVSQREDIDFVLALSLEFVNKQTNIFTLKSEILDELVWAIWGLQIQAGEINAHNERFVQIDRVLTPLCNADQSRIERSYYDVDKRRMVYIRPYENDYDFIDYDFTRNEGYIFQDYLRARLMGRVPDYLDVDRPDKMGLSCHKPYPSSFDWEARANERGCTGFKMIQTIVYEALIAEVFSEQRPLQLMLL